MKHDLLLLDGRHLLWRTADAFKDLSADIDGEEMPTGAIYGFLSIATQIHRRWPANLVVVAWEGSKNFRRALYPGYKKRPMPTEEKEKFLEELNWQQDCIIDLLRRIGVRQYRGVECEADDVLGTIATHFADRGKQILIYSGDSDLRQLVTPSITVVAPLFGKHKEKVYTRAEVLKKHGVPPERLADLKALAGDPSDTIPGVRGIGPKKAMALVSRFEDVEEVISAAKNKSSDWPIAERHRKAIIDQADDVRLFKRLTTILTDAGLSAIEPVPDKTKLFAGLARYSLKSLTVPFRLAELRRMAGR